MPEVLLGRWVRDDAQYAGRTLEVGSHVVRFLDGNSELDAIVVRGVTQETAPGTADRYVVEGTARDGAPVEIALELHRQPRDLLHFETQQGFWRRADAGAVEGSP